MNIIKRGLQIIKAYFYTVTARIMWANSIEIEGLFGKRRDTQIIINNGGKLKIGRNVRFQKRVAITSVEGGKLSIGSNVSFNRNCIVICRKKIEIGSECILGPGVTIYDHDHIFGEEGVLPGYNQSEVVIGSGCWIGANVIILRGTYIGEGCVIGAGSIVKGEIPAHSIVTGERKINIVPIEQNYSRQTSFDISS